MKRRTRILAVPFVLAALFAPASAQDLATAREAWRTGGYEEAIAQYTALGARAGAPPEVYREHAQVLADVGRYDEAERLLASPPAASVHTSRVLGDVRRMRGKLAEAEAAYRRAVEGNGSDANVARLELAVMLLERGDRTEAFRAFDGFIDLYNRGGSLSVEELMAVGDAVRFLGLTDPTLYEDAKLAYERAAQRDRADSRPVLLLGELFLEKYEATAAHQQFDAVLARNEKDPRALLGKARTLDFDGDDARAIEMGRAALETNPNYVEAHTLMARLQLKLEDYDAALSEVQEALEVNPSSLEALSMLAGVYYLKGDRAAYERTRDRALALNPRYPDLYNTVAQLAVEHRQYPEAVALAKQAVALDSTSWWGLGILGINQLRIGQIQEGIANVDRAFKGDPHNVWLFNTLKLTDTFNRFRTVRTQHFELFLHGQEADLLAPYFSQVAEEAYAALRTRYRAEPPLPVRLEVFTTHGDFSVRTLGLVGLGALGVSFGSTLVMDSPAARTAGEFNWASTLWHELAHAFHLNMTNFRVPRWFSEGLAVREQQLARPHWGFRPDIGYLIAYQKGRLHPVSQLNRGFVRPDYPEQVQYSYLQAALVFEMIEERNGVQAILAMMDGYRRGISNEQLVRDVLRTTPEQLDEDFDRWFRQRYANALTAVTANTEPIPPTLPVPVDQLRDLVARSPNDYMLRVTLGRRLLEEEQLTAAEEELKTALRLWPEYGGPDSAYGYLARVHRLRGELQLAAAAMHAMSERDQDSYAVLLEEAKIRQELGDKAGEAAALARAQQVFPYEIESHQRLATLYTEARDGAGAVRERAAVLALNPVDKAGAHLELAKAHILAGDRAAARTQVLRALEIAPGFAEAQELLLQLRGGP
jgi:tetratricopeptide (TPR) repeat protein